MMNVGPVLNKSLRFVIVPGRRHQRRTQEVVMSPFEDARIVFKVRITQRRAMCLTSPSVYTKIPNIIQMR